MAGAAPVRRQAAAPRPVQLGRQEGRPQGGPAQHRGRARAATQAQGGGGGAEAALLPAAEGGRGGIFLQRLLGGLVRSRLLIYSERTPQCSPCGSGAGARAWRAGVSHFDGRSQGGHLCPWQRSLLYLSPQRLFFYPFCICIVVIFLLAALLELLYRLGFSVHLSLLSCSLPPFSFNLASFLAATTSIIL